MRWESFQPVTGLMVKGDKAQGSLSEWRIFRYIEKWFALRSWWNTLVIVEVEHFGQPYYVGFTDEFGDTAVCTQPITTQRFGALLGFEDCTFFAVLDLNDPHHLELEEVDRRPKHEPGPSITVI